jgi:hypothetical protein
MNTARGLARCLLACLFAVPLLASPVTVSATASFTGIIDTWNFEYISGASGVYLQQITINLGPADVFFNTAPGGFGSPAYQDVGNFAGTNVTTGLSSISATGAALDGGSLLTFTFADFTVGDNFTFSADLQHPAPTLLTLQNCTGLGPLATALCNAANAARTVTNDARLAAADTVLSSQLAGALVTFQFGGPGYETTSFTDTLSAATLQEIISGLLDGGGPGSFSSGGGGTTQDPPVPEPATLATAFFGCALLAAISHGRGLIAPPSPVPAQLTPSVITPRTNL